MECEMPDPKDGCVVPAKGPIMAETESAAAQPLAAPASSPGGNRMVTVGKPAPDFEASAFIKGGFQNISLSKFKGKWVVLCFYPGDFTFV
jgi:peroxiredoxin (alkyl hydroperoxide reductase subunit C)